MALALSDAHGGVPSTLYAALTPLTYEELDAGFIHQYWTAEINTTRRSDHNARFRVLWGPLFKLLQGRHSAPALSGLQAMLQDPSYVTNFALTRVFAPLTPNTPSSYPVRTYLTLNNEQVS